MPQETSGIPDVCPCGGGCPRCLGNIPVYAKAAVSQPGDMLEIQADQLARQVMRIPDDPAPVPPTDQPCAVQSSPAAQAVSTALGRGAPLDANTRAFFEPRFGQDLGGVRLHTGPEAASAAGSIDAQAFTAGNHIVFGAGRYAPSSGRGRELIAHELAHVAQQMREPALSDCIQRSPVVLDCTDAEAANIEGAQAQAIRWIDHVLGRLAHPLDLEPELAFHFHTTPVNTTDLGLIDAELRALRDELARDTITYHCAQPGDSMCENIWVSGYSPALSSLEAFFCGNAAADGGESLVSLLFHEAMHARIPGMPDGPYRSDPDYPGLDPLNNTDAYTSFVSDIVSHPITGLPAAPVSEEFGFLPEWGYSSSLSDFALTTHLHGFPLNDATLTAPAVEYLNEFVADWMENIGVDEVVTLNLIGHTDSSTGRERGTELGQWRAEAVRSYLLEELRRWSIPAPAAINVVSFGPTRPYTTSTTARGHALNRRVQIEVRRSTPRAP